MKRLTLVASTLDRLHVGLGTMALEAYLRSQPGLAGEWEVRRIDVHAPQAWWEPRPFAEATVEEVLAGEPDLLGLGLVCWDVDAQLDLACRVKQRRPDLVVVAGGPTASSRGEELLQACAALDGVIRGEGEAPLAALLRAGGRAPEDGFPGLSWRTPAGIRSSVDRGALLPSGAAARAPATGRSGVRTRRQG